jgi:hypothetical protein
MDVQEINFRSRKVLTTPPLITNPMEDKDSKEEEPPPQKNNTFLNKHLLILKGYKPRRLTQTWKIISYVNSKTYA